LWSIKIIKGLAVNIEGMMASRRPTPYLFQCLETIKDMKVEAYLCGRVKSVEVEDLLLIRKNLSFPL
jgi:hypothetical protein